MDLTGRTSRSYRQVGTSNLRGTIQKGPPRRSHFAPPSIPAKFETHLNRDGTRGAHDGFSSRTERFGLNQIHPMPGPGYYDCQAAGDPESSFSQKGFGVGFVSKNRRFGARPLNPLSSLPGPGSYETRAQSATELPRSFNHLGGTAAFHAPLRDVGPAEAHLVRPGPGDYSPVTPRYVQRCSAGTSPFRSRATRFQSLSLEGEVQSGDEEDEEHALRRSIAQNIFEEVRRRREVRGTSSFNSRSHRGESVGERKRSALPGPGAYEAEKLSSKGRRALKSSMFLSSGRDGWGVSNSSHRTRERLQKKQLNLPGPGSYYNSKYDPGSKHSSYTFRSSAPRIEYTSRQHTRSLAPGPAFYKGDPSHDRSSFHINVHHKWV
eukprot:17043_1